MRINKRGSPHILNVNFVILHFKGKEKNINQVRNKKKKAQRVEKKLYSKPGSINSKLSCNLRSKNIHCPSASIPVLRLYSYNIEQFPNAPGLQRSEISKSLLKKKKKNFKTMEDFSERGNTGVRLPFETAAYEERILEENNKLKEDHRGCFLQSFA